MPEVRPTGDVIAVLISDTHFSATPPVCRSIETDWYGVMARHTSAVRALAEKHSCPVVIAGDINDRWNSSPELINWMIRNLKMPFGVFAVPGQHDLPHHRYEDIRKSAYWTLVEAGVVEDLPPGMRIQPTPKLSLYGCPWGFKLEPLDPDDKPAHTHLGVIHDYCWSEGHSFPGSPQEKHWTGHAARYLGYDALVFGDNHSGFLATPSGMNKNLPKSILNCGTFIRRTVADKKRPEIGLLHAGGRIHTVPNSGSTADKLLPGQSPEEKEASDTIAGFMDLLHDVTGLSPDFHKACVQFMDAKNTKPKARKIVLLALESVMAAIENERNKK